MVGVDDGKVRDGEKEDERKKRRPTKDLDRRLIAEKNGGVLD